MSLEPETTEADLVKKETYVGREADLQTLRDATDFNDAAILASLGRLELDGEPVWGLSTDERDLVMQVRQLVSVSSTDADK